MLMRSGTTCRETDDGVVPDVFAEEITRADSGRTKAEGR